MFDSRESSKSRKHIKLLRSPLSINLLHDFVSVLTGGKPITYGAANISGAPNMSRGGKIDKANKQVDASWRHRTPKPRHHIMPWAAMKNLTPVSFRFTLNLV